MNSDEQRQLTDKVTQSVWLVFGVMEGMIALRVLLRLMNANPQNPFAEAVYGLTRPLILPFATLAAQPEVENIVLDVNSIVGMLVYALIAWVIVQAIRILLDPLRRRPSGAREQELRRGSGAGPGAPRQL